jgi:hypothetical protein
MGDVVEGRFHPEGRIDDQKVGRALDALIEYEAAVDQAGSANTAAVQALEADKNAAMAGLNPAEINQVQQMHTLIIEAREENKEE